MIDLLNESKQDINHIAKHLEHVPTQFITEESTEEANQIPDKDFSPWIGFKGKVLSCKPQRKLAYHQFLNNILISPKHKAKFKETPSKTNSDLQILKLNFEKEKQGPISFCPEIFENTSRFGAESFFTKRRNLSKIYQRPKSIELTLDPQTLNLKSINVPNKLDEHNFTKNLKMKDQQSTTFIHNSKDKRKKTMAQTVKNFYPTIEVQRKRGMTLEPRSFSLLGSSRQSPDIIKEVIKKKERENKVAVSLWTKNVF